MIEKHYLGLPVIFQNDSRRMKHLIQDGDNCGQTCVAMVSGKSIKEVEDLVENKHGTYLSNLKLACMVLGVPIVGQWSSKKCYPGNLWPPTCLMLVTTRRSERNHLIVRHGNMFYDPNGGSFYKLPDKYEFCEYLGIETVSVWVDIDEGKHMAESLIVCKQKELQP